MNQQQKTSLAPIHSQFDFILVDGFGSMSSKWWDGLTAIQAYVDTLKSNNVNSHLLLSIFDSTDLEYVARDCDLSTWESLVDNPPGLNGGSTPLYDAINLMGRTLRDRDPKRCSILIVTDGFENGSKFTEQPQAKAILDWCRAKGWQVTFIGAGFDNSQQAKLLGSDAAAAIGVSAKLLPDAARNLGKKRAEYGLFGTAMHFTEGERQQFGGFLAAPESK